ncbi:MAG TPA: DUF5678 domain-containing protein [Thermoplasmata archaeon]|nr:DUF5678 domain-containing protein [Thermoplasmata archaeon]
MAVSTKKQSAFHPEVAAAIKWRASWDRALLKRYAGRWVAIRGRRVVAHGRTFDLLDKALEKLGRPPVLVAQIEARMVVY